MKSTLTKYRGLEIGRGTPFAGMFEIDWPRDAGIGGKGLKVGSEDSRKE